MYLHVYFGMGYIPGRDTLTHTAHGSRMFSPPPSGYDWDSTKPRILKVTTAHGPLAYTVDEPREPAVAIALFFHGNSCDLASPCVREVAYTLSQSLNITAYCFDYCGYGRSGPRCGPAVECTYETGRTMLRLVVERARLSALPLLLIGHSLGGAVMARVCRELSDRHEHACVSALLFLNAFVSPLGVVAWMLRGITIYYDTKEDLRLCSHSRLRMVFASGEADTIVPSAHSEELFEVYKGPKQLYLVPGLTHMSILEHANLLPIMANLLVQCNIATRPVKSHQPAHTVMDVIKQRSASYVAALEAISNDDDADAELLAHLEAMDLIAAQAAEATANEP